MSVWKGELHSQVSRHECDLYTLDKSVMQLWEHVTKLQRDVDNILDKLGCEAVDVPPRPAGRALKCKDEV